MKAEIVWGLMRAGLVVLLLCIWGYNVLPWDKLAYSHSREQTISSKQLWEFYKATKPKAEAILARAKVTRPYRVVDFSNDVKLLHQLKQGLPVGMLTDPTYQVRMQLEKLVGRQQWNQRQYSEYHQLTTARPIRQKFSYADSWPAIAGYLWFMPIAMLLFLFRIQASALSAKERIAVCLHDSIELVVATVFWPLGLTNYMPVSVRISPEGTLLLSKQVREKQRRVDLYEVYETVLVLKEVPIGTRYVELSDELLTFWTMVVAKISLQQLLAPKPWSREWRHSVYCCLVFLAYLCFSKASVLAKEDNEASPFRLDKALLTIIQPEGKPPGESLRLFFHGGTELHVFNMRSPHPSLEVSQNVIRGKWRQGSLVAGPFVGYQDNRLTHLGEVGFASLSPGKQLRLTSAHYLLLTRPNDFRFFTPDSRLHYRPNKAWGIGLGFAASLSPTKPDSFLAGPSIAFSPSKRTTFHLRFGEWLKHPKLRGQQQLRLDLAVAF